MKRLQLPSVKEKTQYTQ